ncbi:MAG: hypothetical protein E6K66_10810 [Nitrospirae bacterium]|nr:MAG: hypothetical protein E6K66_10810 [Nitrospirota bacterium]
MTKILWLSEKIDELREWFRPFRREFVPVYEEGQIDEQTRRVSYGALIACAMIGSSLPLTAWTADLSSLAPVKPRAIVAAGVGYENAETSTITVKTYDAENGAIFSDETYELNVREDTASADSQPRERIFAGGVGPGADGLSAFTLRVYDSATGRCGPIISQQGPERLLVQNESVEPSLARQRGWRPYLSRSSFAFE